MVCPPTKSAFPPCMSYFSMLTFHRDMYSAGITLIWPTHHRLLFINTLTPIVHRSIDSQWPKWRYHNRPCGLSVLAGYLGKDLVNMHFLKKKRRKKMTSTNIHQVNSHIQTTVLTRDQHRPKHWRHRATGLNPRTMQNTDFTVNNAKGN